MPGFAGRFSIILAFIAVFWALFAYWMGHKDGRPDSLSWRRWGRMAFYIHSLLVGVASLMLLYILLNRFYEYRYVWVHVENDLSLGYVMAAFWAGQEGSLLFWVLCQAVFGLLLTRYSAQWESGVMVVVAFSQLFMLSMLMGIRFGGLSIGMDPFLLLREAPANLDNSFFQHPEYLALITDGNGLNPLLRNFWMLSHPPFTFIGYAAVLVPYAFALAGLWRKDHHGWIKPALPWTILGVFFLGIGVLLGGVWAYESLTFGGFWAWDPIENASLVPWLVLVAALHFMLVARRVKHTYFPAFLFILLSFILVVYATYLTRSGVLADTSVHSFGNDGMGLHILTYIFFLALPGVVLLARRFKSLPSKEKDELFSREFWLFVGGMILVLSAFQVIFTTSIPVLNRFLGTDLAPPVDVVSHYNNWQLPFAVAIALLMAINHFIRWGKNRWGAFLGHLSLSLGLALVFTFLIFWLYGIRQPYTILLFAALFAFFSALDVLFRFRSLMPGLGAVIAHLGFALFVVAVVLTFSKKTVISQNTSGYSLGQQFSEHEHLLLIKEEILPMGEFFVRYVGVEQQDERLIYQLDFLKKNAEGDFYKVFSSYPAILLNERMGNVYEPHARVQLFRDIFTYISFADIEQDVSLEKMGEPQTFVLSVGDSLRLENDWLLFRDLAADSPGQEFMDPSHVHIAGYLEVHTHYGEVISLQPGFSVSQGRVFYQDAHYPAMDLLFRLRALDDEPYTIVLDIFEERQKFIVIKTVIFPFINLLWFSMLVMMAGLWLSFRKRWKESGLGDQKKYA